MSSLRRRMTEDMQLRGLSENTQKTYLYTVRRLAAHTHKPPDKISEEELRQYILYLKNEKQLANSSLRVTFCAIKFFYEKTLQRTWPLLGWLRPAAEEKLPVVLSISEVHQVLACVRWPQMATTLRRL
jgi:integrase/recombinase XerD